MGDRLLDLDKDTDLVSDFDFDNEIEGVRELEGVLDSVIETELETDNERVVVGVIVFDSERDGVAVLETEGVSEMVGVVDRDIPNEDPVGELVAVLEGVMEELSENPSVGL